MPNSGAKITHPAGRLRRNVEAGYEDGPGKFLEGDDAAVKEYAKKAQEPEILVSQHAKDVFEAEGVVVGRGGRGAFFHVASRPCTGKCSRKPLYRLIPPRIQGHENGPEDEPQGHQAHANHRRAGGFREGIHVARLMASWRPMARAIGPPLNHLAMLRVTAVPAISLPRPKNMTPT